MSSTVTMRLSVPAAPLVLGLFVFACSPSAVRTSDSAKPAQSRSADDKKVTREPACKLELQSVMGKFLGPRAFRPKRLSSISVSRDDKVLVSSGGGKATVWDRSTGQPRRTFKASHVGLAAGGLWLATVAELNGKTLELNNVANGVVKQRWKLEGKAVRIAASPKGNAVAVAIVGSGTVWIHSVAPGTKPVALEGHKASPELAFSPTDEAVVASAGNEGRLKLWDIRTGESNDLRTGSNHRMMDIKFSPDGKLLAAGDRAGYVWVFDTKSAAKLHHFKARVPGESPDITTLSISNGAQRMLVSSYGAGTVALWEPKTERLIAVLAEEKWSYSALTLSADGKTAIAGTRSGAIRFWDTQSGVERPVIEPGNVAQTNAIAWAADGRRAIVAAGGHWASAWDLGCGKPTGRLGGHTRRVERVASTPDGRLVATAGNDGWLRVWDGRSLKLLHEVGDHSGRIEAVAFSTDGKRVATGGRLGKLVVRTTDSFAVLWERPKGKKALALALSADGSLLIVGGRAQVEWLDVSSGTVRAQRKLSDPGLVSSVVVSPDGELVATSSSATVNIFATKTAELRMTFSATPDVTGAAWFPDSRRLVFGNLAGHLNVVNAVTGAIERHQRIEGVEFAALALSRDGRRLLTGHYDTTLRLWDPNQLSPFLEKGFNPSIYSTRPKPGAAKR